MLSKCLRQAQPRLAVLLLVFRGSFGFLQTVTADGNASAEGTSGSNRVAGFPDLGDLSFLITLVAGKLWDQRRGIYGSRRWSGPALP
jgi:hypothetical protein